MVELASGVAQPLTIPGPSGDLEALLDAPPDAQNNFVAVICHPHPSHGGTMTNKVAHMLAKSFVSVGATAIRFNFRGVGGSAGEYAQGDGETDDALAVIDWVRATWPQAHVWLGGFSFGGAVAIRAAARRSVGCLVTVAPAVDRVDVPIAALPKCPWLVVQGDADEVVPALAVNQWLSALPTMPQLVMLPDVGHFFHGTLNLLKDEVVQWLEAQVMK
jgi:alpha/beta superfamily hydrolase